MSAVGSQVKPGQKRPRSPLWPPIVLDYRPYTGRQLTQPMSSHKSQWDLYYRNNTVNGYKDRHYILREFCELGQAIMDAKQAEEDGHVASDGAAPHPISWMEAGCGVGNAMLPVFEEYGALSRWDRLVGFDISSVAIQLLQAKRDALIPALKEKLHVCVLDPTESDVADCTFFTKAPVPQSADLDKPALAVSNPVRFVSMVFVLCSIPPALHTRVLARIAACMARPGGVFFFRDYAAEDQAQKRFRARDSTTRGAPVAPVASIQAGEPSSSASERLQAQALDNTYTRTNGTLSHFFTIDEVTRLFEGAGFDVIDLRLVEVEVTNRKKGLCFDRRFVQGRFRLKDI